MHVFMDFDSTITTTDTIELLGLFASKRNGVEREWAALSNEYSAKIEAHREAHPLDLVIEPFRGGKHRKKLIAAIVRWINSQRDIEDQAVKRTYEYGIFKNLTQEQLYEAGRDAVVEGRIQIRDGFSDFIVHLRQKHFDVTVLSLNWSNQWIRGCIRPFIHPSQTKIMSNRVQGGRLEGYRPYSSVLLTGKDKLSCMNDRLKEWRTVANPIVYIGDSVNDLQCMLRSDKAIVMCGPDLAANGVMRLLGILGESVPHVSDCGKGFRFAWAENFTEILSSGILDPDTPKGIDDGRSQTAESSAPSRAEEPSAPTQTEELSTQTQTEKPSTQTQTDESSMPTHTEESFVPTQKETSSVATQTEEPSTQTRTEVSSVSTQTEESFVPIQKETSWVAPRTEKDYQGPD